MKRFKQRHGRLVEEIPGQGRLGYAMSDTEDFCDLPAWLERGGYQGSVLTFCDFETGDVYAPFARQRNVVYSPPIYAEGRFWFLRGDFGAGRIGLYRYCPGTSPERVASLPEPAVVGTAKRGGSFFMTLK